MEDLLWENQQKADIVPLADSLKVFKNKLDQLHTECDFLSNGLSGIIVSLYLLKRMRDRNEAMEPVVLLVNSRIYQSYLYLAKITGIIPVIEVVVIKNLCAVRKSLDSLEREMRPGVLVICRQLYAEHHSEILSSKIGRKAVII